MRCCAALGDADSAVSKLVAARGGYDLMPELGYQPVNKYLPPRPRRDASCASTATQTGESADFSGVPLLRWLDKLLTR